MIVAKYVCGAQLLGQQQCVVYSFGSNGEVTFERDMIEKAGCEVHVFDPTLNEEQKQQVRGIQGKFVNPILLVLASQDLSELQCLSHINLITFTRSLSSKRLDDLLAPPGKQSPYNRRRAMRTAGKKLFNKRWLSICTGY